MTPSNLVSILLEDNSEFDVSGDLSPDAKTFLDSLTVTSIDSFIDDGHMADAVDRIAADMGIHPVTAGVYASLESEVENYLRSKGIPN